MLEHNDRYQLKTLPITNIPMTDTVLPTLMEILGKTKLTLHCFYMILVPKLKKHTPNTCATHMR